MERELRIGFIQASNDLDVHWFKPLAFGYLMSYLDKNLKTPVSMMLLESVDNIADYDIIAISSTSQDYVKASEIAHRIKCTNEKTITILGGHHITYLPATLTKDFNIGVLGEGEQTFLELIDYFQCNELRLISQKLKKIKGIVFWDDGKLVRTQKRDLIKPLDTIPHPARQLGEAQYIFTSRGCPYKCAFCSSSAFWDKPRLFSAEYVVNEIRQILDQFPDIKHIPIQDDLFIISNRRLNRMVQLLEQARVNERVAFSFAVRANLITDKLCETLKRLNIQSVCFGAESASDRLLKIMRKNTTAAMNQKALDILHKYGITAVCSFIVGWPSETEEEVRATYEFIMRNISQGKLSPGSAVNILAPMPGTEVWDNAVKEGIIDPSAFNWNRLAFFASYRHSNADNFSKWLDYRRTNNSLYLNKDSLPQERLYEIMHEYEEQIKALECSDAETNKSASFPTIFPESLLAHKYCKGKGLEIGGSAHNPFALNTLNVDITDSMDTIFKKEEMNLCGKALKVDIVASGDNIPLPDESQDFIVSSHVLEHLPNPIKALLEWDRLIKRGGIIFMIVPHKERTFDKYNRRTPLQHLIADYYNNTRALGNPNGHEHYWITEDIVELITWMIDNLSVKWEMIEVSDVDDKVGNGFTIVIRKQGTRNYSGSINLDSKNPDLLNSAQRPLSLKDTHISALEKRLKEKDGLISNLETVIRDYKRELGQLFATEQKMNSILQILHGLIKTLTKENISAELSVKAGELCFSLGSYDNARSFFDKAISLDPRNSEALNNLGVLSFQVQNYNSAQNFFLEALSLDPNNKEAEINLKILSEKVN